jgi:hypothetical protein
MNPHARVRAACLAMLLSGCANPIIDRHTNLFSSLRELPDNIARSNADPLAGHDRTTGEVTDSSKVEFVEGLTGFMGAGFNFGRYSECSYGVITATGAGANPWGLRIGMPIQEVFDAMGFPTAQHAGTAHSMGLLHRDLHKEYRVEWAYAGMGRLVFAYADPEYFKSGLYKLGLPAAERSSAALGGREPPMPACKGLRLIWTIVNGKEPSGPMEIESAHLWPYTGPAPEDIGLQLPEGFNDIGEVVDPCVLQRPKPLPKAGQAPSLQFTGRAAPGSRFVLLRQDMSRGRVEDILGPPAGMSKCGRIAYSGQGELEYAPAPGGGERLVWVIFNRNEVVRH